MVPDCQFPKEIGVFGWANSCPDPGVTYFDFDFGPKRSWAIFCTVDSAARSTPRFDSHHHHHEARGG